MNGGNIFNLIQLIDDPDPVVFETVRSEILKTGKASLKELESHWDTSSDDTIRERIEEIIDTIQFEALKNQLSSWVNVGNQDLLYGAYLIALLEFPELEFNELSAKLNQIKVDVWLELAPSLTALEKVKILNHILFDVHKFSGNLRNYYSPQNSYISQVIDRKKGNPISLSIIYSVIAQGLDIPIYGVNLPKNYILAYLDTGEPIPISLQPENHKVLFYINPFNRGAIFSRKEIDEYLKQQRIEPELNFYYPCSTIDTIYRIVHNLSFVYNQNGNKEKIRKLHELKKIIKPLD